MPTEVVGRHETLTAVEALMFLKQGLYVTYEMTDSAVMFTPNSDDFEVLMEVPELVGGVFVIRKRIAA